MNLLNGVFSAPPSCVKRPTKYALDPSSCEETTACACARDSELCVDKVFADRTSDSLLFTDFFSSTRSEGFSKPRVLKSLHGCNHTLTGQEPNLADVPKPFLSSFLNY